MRVGILADIHGNLPALQACWRELESLGTDITVCLGDLVQYGPYPSEVIDFVRDHGIASLQGNCDRAVARSRSSTGDRFESTFWETMATETLAWTADTLGSEGAAFLRRLPQEIRLEADRVKVLCVHGLPGNITGELPEPSAGSVVDHLLDSGSCRVLLAGHTHRMSLASRPSGMLVNPGSVGGGTLPGQATMAVLDVDESGVPSISWHRVGYDMDPYERKFRHEGLPETFLKCIKYGRDPRGGWHVDDIIWRHKWAEH